MVKKLFKHEILSYLRIWIPIQIVLLVVSLMGRIAWIFEPESDVYKVLFGMAVAIYVMNIISSFFIMYIFSIVRFYKNMFSHEGYLTLTLPVTSSQHIWVKSLSALLFTVLSVITVFVSFAIFSSGDPFVEIMKALGYLIKIECIDRGALYVMAIIILSAINMLVRIFSGFVLVYAFIAIGQRARKNKVLISILAYIIYSIGHGIIMGILAVLYFAIPNLNYYDLKFREAFPGLYDCTTICIQTLGSALIALIAFVIVNRTIKNKLNLE